MAVASVRTINPGLILARTSSMPIMPAIETGDVAGP
jgi:hypothetical protein